MKIHSAASLCGSGARAVLRPNGIRTPASRPPTSLRASAPLKDWFHSKAPQEGVQLELMQSSIADGAGLKATVGVSKGQVVLSVPRSLVMDSQSARASLGDAAADQLPEWALMTLHLLTEKAKGPKSQWHAYISALPDQSHHPICWPAEMRAALLKGSSMLDTIERLQREATATLESLRPLASGLDLTEQTVLWAAATLLSRGKYLDFTSDAFSMALAEADSAEDDSPAPVDGAEGDEEEEGQGADIFDGLDGDDGMAPPPLSLALVPWADLLNHASDAPDSAEPKFDAAKNSIVFRACRDFAAGEEVLTSYGVQRSASELLVDYGFVDARNSNYWIEVPLKELSRTAKRGNQRLIDTCLAGIGEEEVTVVLDEGGPDATILSWVRTAHASLEDLQRAGWDVGIKLAPKGGFGRGASGGTAPAPTPVSEDEEERAREVTARALMVVSEFEEPAGVMTELRALESLVSLMDDKLAGYPTALEDDTAFLRAAESGTATTSAPSLLPTQCASDSRWQRTELYVRRALASEKRALQGTKAAAMKWISMIKRGIPLRKVYRLRGKDKARVQEAAAAAVEEEMAMNVGTAAVQGKTSAKARREAEKKEDRQGFKNTRRGDRS